MASNAPDRSIRKLRTELFEIHQELALVQQLKAANNFLTPYTDLRSSLTAVLRISMSIADADFGDLQLFDPASGTLKIVAHHGFGEPFLEFFDRVHSGQTACGAAMKHREGVFVQDVTSSPIFQDNETIEVMLAANSRSVRSFPLIAGSSRFVGVMSSLYRAAKPFSPRQLLVQKILATNVADFIERKQFGSWRRFSSNHLGGLADSGQGF